MTRPKCVQVAFAGFHPQHDARELFLGDDVRAFVALEKRRLPNDLAEAPQQSALRANIAETLLVP